MISLANNLYPFSVPLIAYNELFIDLSRDLFESFEQSEEDQKLDTFIYNGIRYGYDLNTPIIKNGRLIFHKSSHNHEINLLIQNNALHNGVICSGTFWEPVDEKGISTFDPEAVLKNKPPVTTRLLNAWGWYA